MNGSIKASFEFGEYRLVPAERLLLKNGNAVQLPPKAFDILVVLVENAGELVENNQMLELVWHDRFVEESNIQVQISAVRRMLNGDRDLIETVPKVGYRFTASVKVGENGTGQNGQRLGTGKTTHAETAGQADVQTGEEAKNIRVLRTDGGRRWLIFMSAGLVLLIAGSLYFLATGGFKNPFRRRANFPIASMKMINMTRSGSAHDAAISPDGSLVAYQISSEGRNSLWLNELGTGGDVQIMAPSQDAEYGGLTFSADGQFLYYLAPSGIAPNLTSALYRIPKVGGSPVRLLDGVDSPVSVSPDGKRLAFVRQNNGDNGTLLLAAAADGKGDPQEIAALKSPEYFATKRPSWSPDGSTLAVVARTGQEKFLRLLTVDVATGEVRNLTSEKWVALQDVQWLPDSDNLLITAQDDVNFGPLQIWRTSVSQGGRSEKITPEVVNYVGLSLDRSGRALVTTQSDAYNNIWTVGRDEHGPGKMVLPNRGGGRVDMSWTRSGRIIYLNAEGGGQNIFSMLPDGSDQRQLTSDGSPKKCPVVSPDDKYIVYVAASQGTDQLWRMDIDGQNQRLLVPEWIYRYPVITLDSKWVMYTTWLNEGGKGRAYIWKVPIEGGDSIQIHEPVEFTPDISPDGTKMAYLEKQADRSILRVLPIAGDAKPLEFTLPKSVPPDPVRWTLDGRGLTYMAPGPVVPNMWVQALDGSVPAQLTNFTYDPPRFCEWSRDEKLLSCVRSNRVRDILLFKSGD